jgi:hypothetical protein
MNSSESKTNIENVSDEIVDHYQENGCFSSIDNNEKNNMTYSNSHVFVNYMDYFPIVESLNKLKTNTETRKTIYRNKITMIFTLSISIFLTILWFYRLITFSLNNSIYNLIWIPITILSIFILLFPINIVTTGCANMFGSTEFFFTNSKYFSCIKEEKDNNKKFTKITIQIPIYIEDFDTVIKSTLKSAMLCRKYYNYYTEHDISVNIVINDDGLQVLSYDEYLTRINFYKKHKIGYIGRQKEGRKGKFKKASNMNFCLNISKLFMKLNEKFTLSESLVLIKYNHAIKNKKIEIGGDISIGDFILLLDSDTRIPFNCFNDVITEFYKCPNLGFTQHLTYPFIITNTYWEKFIAHFTTLIYDLAIPISVAGGDISPLVGHCAILRTDALWRLLNKNNKIWSETNVSEDFKLFMDLTELGYYGRYVTYTSNLETKYFEKHNFMEGISLEYIDELAKFKKYCYGMCEILFNPINMWLKHGCIGSPIIKYCKSDIEITSKIGIIAYLFTYIAISIGLPIAYFNYFLYGWLYNYIDTNILPLYIIIQVSLLFSGFGTLANSIFKARVLRKDAINVLWYNILQTPFYMLFFGSLSYHFNHIIFKYFVGYDKITWGSTRKEITYLSRIDAFKSTIFEFRYMYIFFSLTISMIIIMHTDLIPSAFKITEINAIIPLLTTSIFHICAPILLNPFIMTNNVLKRIKDDDNEHELNLFIDT